MKIYTDKDINTIVFIEMVSNLMMSRNTQRQETHQTENQHSPIIPTSSVHFIREYPVHADVKQKQLQTFGEASQE